jgi:hypothetical protein
MTSTIKVNTIQNTCGADIIKESSNTITIGASGDTVTLASGASQTGFGRNGTVNWQTTIKTGDFTAASGEGYFIDTSSGAVTMTLPSSPSAGDIVAVKDYALTFDTNNLTVNRNSQPIGGQANNGILETEGIAVTYVYADSTKGWQVTESGLQSEGGTPQFITATGGTETTSGNFKIHTFTGPGTFSVTKLGNAAGSTTVDYLVVAGGGSGGSNGGGGGAGGGYRESSGAASGCYSRSPLGACVSALPVCAQAYPIVVGAGGTAAAATPSSGSRGTSGGTSSFSTISSAGGGAGGGFFCASSPLIPGNSPGAAGGSGGGGGAQNPGNPVPGGAGNTPPVSPPQGNSGGSGLHCGGSYVHGGGAGGATASGGNQSAPKGGDGGAGGTSSINGTPTARAGGAGGAGFNPRAAGTPGGGGAGTSAGAPPAPTTNGTAGTANTGGGGGAGAHPQFCGANGGSGIVIIRYQFQ